MERNLTEKIMVTIFGASVGLGAVLLWRDWKSRKEAKGDDNLPRR